ncbi:hypothetical protein [Subtercola vilae]|uniref:hypothetical protein n=1 Tax=Subtercola vilae TaxID=2056433 RepID=UPI0010AA3AC3|nr:hypothetical protein [Subtercola vilae]
MTANAFYSDRVSGETPRTLQTLPAATADGLLELVMTRLAGNWLAEEFPERCPDSDKSHIFATNVDAFADRAKALIPKLQIPLLRNRGDVADDTIFDLIELAGRFVALPSEGANHAYYSHHALTFDRHAGAKQYCNDVNEILARGGAAFEMQGELTIAHIGPAELREALSALNPDTGDIELDKLIENGRQLVASRQSSERLAGIQALWGALERLKTVEVPGKNQKNVSAEALLAHIGSASLRDAVRTDLNAVTALGNTFRVRHHETHIAELPEDAYDYFTGRVVTVLHILLSQSRRLVDQSEPSNNSPW